MSGIAVQYRIQFHTQFYPKSHFLANINNVQLSMCGMIVSVYITYTESKFRNYVTCKYVCFYSDIHLGGGVNRGNLPYN